MIRACQLPPDNGRNIAGGDSGGTFMNVSCLVRGVYPLPQVKLTLGEFDLLQVTALFYREKPSRSQI